MVSNKFCCFNMFLPWYGIIEIKEMRCNSIPILIKFLKIFIISNKLCIFYTLIISLMNNFVDFEITFKYLFKFTSCRIKSFFTGSTCNPWNILNITTLNNIYGWLINERCIPMFLNNRSKWCERIVKPWLSRKVYIIRK